MESYRCYRPQFFLGCLVILTILAKTEGYAMCGDPLHKAAEAEVALDEVMDRLMRMRKPNWLWGSLTTVNAIQLAAPERFFGRRKSLRAIKKLVQDSWDNLQTFEFAQLAFLARSLCLNPRRLAGRDVMTAISNSLPSFIATQTEEREADHWIFFSLMLSGLCINDYPIETQYVEAILSEQNADGSFGSAEVAEETTIFMLRPLYCLTKMSNAEYDTLELLEAVLKMRDFLLTKVHQPDPNSPEVYIGPPEFTSDAVAALFATIQPGEDPNIDWRCREVIDTLGLMPVDSDEEDDLQERLYRITGRDYLDLQSCEYTCLKRKDLDRIPKGYKPTCEEDKPETCV